MDERGAGVNVIEIVRHGKHKRIYFVCKHCGCVFWADERDGWHMKGDGVDWYGCDCPECDVTCLNGGGDDVRG